MEHSEHKAVRFLYQPIPMTPTDWLVDAVIAAGAFGFGLVQLTISASLFVPDDFIRRIIGIQALTPNVAAITATFVMSVPLVVRRRLPWIAFVSSLVLWAVCEYLSRSASFSTIAPLVALFTIAYERERAETLVAAGIMLACTVLPALGWRSSGLAGLLVFQNAATIVAVGFAGYALRERQQAIAAAEARASDAERLRESETMRAEAAESLQALEARRAQEAERTRESEASRRVEEERVRIARELHDITAHSLSAVSIQAAAAERLVDTDPAAARAAIGEVRSTAKEALADMRSMVGVLRSTGDAPMEPTEGTDRLETLVDYLEGAQVACTLMVADYNRAQVPKHVDLALFGIAREAVTNIVRHSAATQAQITLTSDEQSARLSVCDNGRGMVPEVASDSSGHGIEGMRERMRLLEGELSIEPSPQGGTCIMASVPLPGKERSS